jgi:hypothetical protein
MTRFEDQLLDDLMREHGPALAHVSVPAARRRPVAARPVLLTAGAGGVALAVTVGTLAAGGGNPAYAVTTHPDGTVTLAVYQASGIAAANSKLHQLGDRVVVVPVGSNCPSIGSLPTPAVPAKQISLEVSGSSDGSVTVDAQGIPAGDILVLGFSANGGRFQFSMQESMSRSQGQGGGKATVKGDSTSASHAHAVATASAIAIASGDGSGPGPGMPQPVRIASKLTSGPAPSCISIPVPPVPGGPGGTPASGSASGGS